MKSPRWLTLAALALAGALPAPARAQWVPGGTLIASNVDDPFSFGVVAVPDGQAGALVLALEHGTSEFDHAVIRVGPDGRIPAGWPSTAIQPTFFTMGLAADLVGGAYVGRTKEGPAGSLIVVRHLLADGTLDPAWPAGGRVVADIPGTQGIQLASDGAGGVYVAFEGGSVESSRLGVLRLDISGAPSPGWPADGVTLVQAAAYIFFGDLQVTSAGLYLEGYLSATAPSAFPHDAFVARLTPGGAIPTGWGSGTVVVPFLPAGTQAPPYTPDASGGYFYTWRNGFLARLVHVLADATLDPAWPVPGLALLADTTRFQYIFKPVSDGAGGCFSRFAYDSAGTGTGLSVVHALVHITSQGTPEPGWPSLGGRLPHIDSGFIEGDVVPDDNGGAYVTWVEGGANVPAGSGYRTLRAHHLAFGGVTAPYWPAAGMTLASGPGARFATKLVTDSHGGAIAVWSGTRTETAPSDSVDVFALGFGPDGSLTTSVGEPRGTMLGELRANPVPSRGPTNLSFALAHTAHVSLDVFDLSGRRIRSLLEGTFAPGPHSVAWDGVDDAGRSVPPGVYLAHANGDGVVSSARLVRVR